MIGNIVQDYFEELIYNLDLIECCEKQNDFEENYHNYF